MNTIEEYTKTGGFKAHPCPDRQTFLRLVDRIRRQKGGWKLLRLGQECEPEAVFGSKVYYGVNAPSQFHDTLHAKETAAV
jgi:hypothetical protein